MRRGRFDPQVIVYQLRRINQILDGILGVIDRVAQGAHQPMEVPRTDIGDQSVEPTVESSDDIHHGDEIVVDEDKKTHRGRRRRGKN